MKTTLCLVVCAGVMSLWPSARAVPPESGDTSTAEQQMRIVQRVRPAFPARLARRGVTSGEVRLIVQVDASGALLDSLVVASTHLELTDTMDLVVSQWRFLPGAGAGEPRATMIDVAARFTRGGMTLDVHGVNDAPAWDREAFADFAREEYELDAPLKATREPTPVNPAMAGEEPMTGVARVAFYVDEHGRVRMPYIVSADDDRLGWAALAALRQTWYQVPQRRGKPVLTHVIRTFSFGPGA